MWMVVNNVMWGELRGGEEGLIIDVCVTESGEVMVAVVVVAVVVMLCPGSDNECWWCVGM